MTPIQLSTADWTNLRATIIAVGEIKKWWPTSILTGEGEEFLSYVLPKTKKAASHQLALEICRSEHDKQIGPGRYHLFRLPQKWEIS